MPSEVTPSFEPSDAVRKLLQRARDPFHSALARAIEELRTFLNARETTPEEHVRGAEASLGAFASGRVDAERFSALLSQTLSLDPSDAERMERAFVVLCGLNERIDALFELRVPPGGSLHDEVEQRLSEIGRAFGAAHVVAEIRAGTYNETWHAPMLEAYPFARWSAAERVLAPALYVEVQGIDCRAAALAEFLDGHARIVLRVAEPCPVAPLARLITPRAYVAQTDDLDALKALATSDGPAIAALVPEDAARFVHAPAANGNAGGLQVAHLPEGIPHRVGGVSSAQQKEDLRLLAGWTSPATPAPADVVESEDTSGKLASWLLQQADLGSTE